MRATSLTRCSLFGGKLTGGSQVNHELLTVLSQGSMRLNRGECATVRPIVDTVVQLMTVPLILTLTLTPNLTPTLTLTRCRSFRARCCTHTSART